DTKARIGPKSVRGREPHTHSVSPRVEFDAVERSGIKLEPQADRRNKNSAPESIKGFEFDPVSVNADIAAKGLPTELGVLNKISRGVCRHSKEVRPIVSGVRVPLHVVR